MDSASRSELAVVVLAAGQGTRLKSQQAKVLHRAAGRTLVRHVLEATRPLAARRTVVVVGHQSQEVQADVESAGIDGLVTVEQREQRGTGHAVQQALGALADAGWVLVLYGDTPLLTSEVLGSLAVPSDAAVRILTAHFDDPTGYGRIIRDGDGRVIAVVEEADATADQRELREGNAGMYLFRRDVLVDGLAALQPHNEQVELYLTDLVEFARSRGHDVEAVVAPAEDVAGVNDRRQLSAAAAVLRRRHLDHLMVDIGVSVVDPATTYVDVDVQVGNDSVLLPGTILESGTRIGQRAVIGPHTHLVACVVGDGATVHSSRGERVVIGDDASVGPFTHLRAGTVLDASTKVGAYVETKNVTVGVHSKIPHLAYIGDATVGAGVNLACGVVTVNYDGRDKHHTHVEDGAFVGCDTMLVAPVTIGAGAYTAAGSTITDDVPPGALAIARSRQTNKPGWVRNSSLRQSISNPQRADSDPDRTLPEPS